MIVMVFYQDFKLNGTTFNPSRLILNEKDSVAIASYHVNRLRDRCDEFQISLPEDCSKEEVCDACFKLFNLYPMEAASSPSNFKRIGHTSMSVGDYIMFLDTETDNYSAHIVAPEGWKIIDNMEVYRAARAAVITKMENLPIEVYMGMLELLHTNEMDFNGLLSGFSDKRCENMCPRCESEKINWGMKDYTDSLIFQNGKCEDCGLDFTEEYTYTRTSVNEELETEIESAK